MTIDAALGIGRERLSAAGVDDAPLDTALLLGEVLGVSRAEVLAHPERVLTQRQQERFLELITGREGRVPFAYLVGRREFMGLSFHVSPAALIPRADTETLVEEAMRHLHDGMRFLDLCTGTGCVALSLLRYSNDTTAIATDISEEALALAKKNARELGVADRVRFVRADLWPVGQERFDLIVANPPYVETAVIAELQPEVRAHEPSIALDGGADGLDFYRRICGEAAKWLCSDGWLAVEIGFDQGERVCALFEGAGFHAVEVIKDFGGQDRVVKGCYYV